MQKQSAQQSQETLRLCELARLAGAAIIDTVRDGSRVATLKQDQSPVTAADLAANAVLLRGIASLSPFPIISEESARPNIDPDKPFWLVDPLDGTRDFVAGLETFVVCIALIENRRPTLGVIHQPTSGLTWWARKGLGAFGPTNERISNDRSQATPLKAAGSRSTPSEKMQKLYSEFGVDEIVRFGSALKFCKLAEGEFDFYPRFGPTSEWDTGAGQIIAEEAGCHVIDLKTSLPLTYGKPDFLNSGFVASRVDLDIVGRLKARGLT